MERLTKFKIDEVLKIIKNDRPIHRSYKEGTKIVCYITKKYNIVACKREGADITFSLFKKIYHNDKFVRTEEYLVPIFVKKNMASKFENTSYFSEKYNKWLSYYKQGTSLLFKGDFIFQQTTDRIYNRFANINKNNYYLCSKGNFKNVATLKNFQIVKNFITKKLNEGWELNHESKSSFYLVKNDELIRISDHGGDQIRSCNWQLDNNKGLDCKKTRGTVGLIDFANFKPNYQNIDMTHYQPLKTSCELLGGF